MPKSPNPMCGSVV